MAGFIFSKIFAKEIWCSWRRNRRNCSEFSCSLSAEIDLVWIQFVSIVQSLHTLRDSEERNYHDSVSMSTTDGVVNVPYG